MKQYLRVCSWIAIALLASASMGAVAQEVKEVDVQGNYEGAFTGDWASKPLAAKIIARGNGRYEAQLLSGDVKDRFSGKTPVKDKAPTFNGTVELDGKAYTLKADYADGTISGQLVAKKKTIDFSMKRVRKESPTMGAKPPEGANVLFDGTNLDKWRLAIDKWQLVDGDAMRITSSSLVTNDEFGDHKLHVEFKTPFMPRDSGQGRGNSGVYVHGCYEVQVLDTFGLEPADNYCGGIYKIAVPSENACLPPEEWQTYDITFTAPRFDASGKKTKSAVINVVHNGITIHKTLELPNATPGGSRGDEAPLGPLWLQHHGNGVKYRNIWAQPLETK